MKPGDVVETDGMGRWVKEVTCLPDRDGGMIIGLGAAGLYIASESTKLSGPAVRRGTHQEGIPGYYMCHADLGGRAIRECVLPVGQKDGLYELVEGASLTFSGVDGASETIEGPAEIREL